MGFFKMKRGMVFVMLTLFGSCVYTGTFFYLSLIEDSEGILSFPISFSFYCLGYLFARVQALKKTSALIIRLRHLLLIRAPP